MEEGEGLSRTGETEARRKVCSLQRQEWRSQGDEDPFAPDQEHDTLFNGVWRTPLKFLS